MTEVREEGRVDTGERELLVRTFSVAQQELDGRTLHVRVVPFNEVATVADPPDFRPYKEEFLPGVFKGQENAAHRIRLRHRHDDDLLKTGVRGNDMDSIVGKGVSLQETDGGVEAEFRFLETDHADTALELTREGGFDGVSAEFVGIRSRMSRQGIKQRVKAHLDSVALALGPAYSKAEILAIREGREEIIDEELLPPPVNTELLARCADLGIALPDDMALLLSRAYTEATWDGSPSRWDTPEAYCAASAIDLNPSGKPKTKANCHLPYKEPGSGTININGVRNALARIGQGDPKDATQAQRDAAKATLEKLLNSFNSTTN